MRNPSPRSCLGHTTDAGRDAADELAGGDPSGRAVR
jgi:hypothetical protein